METSVDYQGLTRLVETVGNLDQPVLDALANLIRRYVVLMLDEASAAMPKKTGRLADHLVGRVDKGSMSVHGVVGTRGVAYAHFMEHGFHGGEAIAAHARTVKKVFGRPITVTQMMKAHVRQMDFAGDPVLLPILDQHWPEIQQAILDAVANTVRQEITPS